MRLVFDIEANNLLNDETIDYNTVPYKLKDNFKVWFIVTKDIDSGEIRTFVGEQLKSTFIEYISKATMLISHNGIGYDHLVLKLFYGLDYSVNPDTFNNKPVEIVDTLVLSKTLNPDRFGGHSLDAWGKRLGDYKIGFHDFSHYSEDMLTYCIQDVNLTHQVYNELNKETAGWDWAEAISLEKSVAEIVVRQEHRGFRFNKEAAENCVSELDNLMQEREERVIPILPPKPIGKTAGKEFTPPKIQFKKNGEHSLTLLKFIEKHQGHVTQEGMVELFGTKYELPLPLEPLIKTLPAKLKDTTHIKEWLVSMGWEPMGWKERDLTVNSKKVKLTQLKFEEAVNRYIEQTLNSKFCKYRCKHLRASKATLSSKLLAHDLKKPLKVLTNPTFTIGQDKEICPNLQIMHHKFPFVQDVVEYLTYSHRRNSILGGGLDVDGDDEPEKGYLANYRSDGRIATPADTCGCGTSRFKHRVVANIPRVTSLYGKEMRALFGVDSNSIQVGYDFDSLEAKIESHYCWKYDTDDKEYCKSLTLDKPNDVHTKTAEKIAKIINAEFSRGNAKNVKYGCVPVDNTQVLTYGGWKSFDSLEVGMQVLSYSQVLDCYEWQTIDKLWFYEDADVYTLSNRHLSLESTSDHRWFGTKRKEVRQDGVRVKVKFPAFITTEDFNSECAIQHASTYNNKASEIKPIEAALIGWLLSDGYYKWSEKSDVTSSSGGTKKGVVASITQARFKYTKELRGIIEGNNLPYVLDTLEAKNGKIDTYRIKSGNIRDFLDRVVGSRLPKHDVNWCEWVLKLDQPALQAFLDNFILADGHKDRRNNSTHITQNVGNICDAVILAANLCNYRVTFNNKTEKCLVLNLSKNVFTTGQRLERNLTRKANVFCLSVANGTFVMKQGTFVTITGNCSYGAQAARVAKTIGCSVPVGQQIFDGFWESAKPLALLKERLTKYWEREGGKKFILGIDGRKIPTRSSHALVNSLFQSAGVICAKRAMVIHDRKLKERGLIVDFFSEALPVDYCQQLIAYHDESQLEVPSSSVKFKSFVTKEEAKDFKHHQELKGLCFSDIGEANNKFFVGYCEAGQLAVESVTEAGRYYNLNIELTAGYMLGRDWATCH